MCEERRSKKKVWHNTAALGFLEASGHCHIIGFGVNPHGPEGKPIIRNCVDALGTFSIFLAAHKHTRRALCLRGTSRTRLLSTRPSMKQNWWRWPEQQWHANASWWLAALLDTYVVKEVGGKGTKKSTTWDALYTWKVLILNLQQSKNAMVCRNVRFIISLGICCTLLKYFHHWYQWTRLSLWNKAKSLSLSVSKRNEKWRLWQHKVLMKWGKENVKWNIRVEVVAFIIIFTSCVRLPSVNMKFHHLVPSIKMKHPLELSAPPSSRGHYWSLQEILLRLLSHLMPVYRQ